MKRIIMLITLAGASLSVQAQQSVIDVDASPAKAFYATQEWERAFMGYYGVESGTEPGIPEDVAERETLAAIRTFLQTGRDGDFLAAMQAIETLIQDQQTQGLQTSPMMLQIAGTLQMRIAELSKNETESTRLMRKAEDYFKRAIDSNTGFPNFLRAHKNLANLLFKMDRPAEAKAHFIKAIELGDRDSVTFGILGAIFMDEDKLISSETALRNSLMINPNIPQFKQLLGNVLMQQERYAEAKEIFSELLMKSPNESTFWMAQANCYIALEDIEQAAKNLEIVRFMGKANVPSLMLLGNVYMNKEMIVEAAEIYQEAVKLNPGSTNVEEFLRATETLNNYAAYEQAMELIKSILKAYAGNLTDENQIDLLSLSSEINISLGKGEEASRNLEDLLKKDPFNSRALLTLARYYSDLEADESLPSEEQDLMKRRYEQKALIYFERAQNLDDIQAQVRAYIGEAQLRVQRDELEIAADLLEEAQALSYQDTVQSYLDQIREVLKNRRRT
jgi:tetratricopeptide (TPR) repeat protein